MLAASPRPRETELVRLLCILLAGALAGGVPLLQAARPNVLFIAIDDLRPELGCYGAQHVHSPRIDGLAASGATFLSAHCQVAVCNPSRASLMTGRYPDTIRVWDLRAHFRDLNPDIVTLPQHFKAHGYTSAAFGKIFHNPLPDRRSWSEPNHWPRGTVGYSEESLQQHRATRQRLQDEGKPPAAVQRVRPPATEIIETDDDDAVLDGAIAKAALQRMEELADEDQPFFLAVGFIRPHLAFLAPRKYWDLYERGEIPLVADPSLPRDAPPFAMNTMYELRDYCDFLGTPTPLEGALTEEQQRRLKHGYLACVSFIDTQVGRLLDGLGRLGLDDDTIVVLWGDHGWKLGEHRSWCKQTNYEIDTRVPLLIRAPGMQPGIQPAAPVELVDLYPTLCELADLDSPEGLEGDSLVPFLTSTIQSDPGTPSAAGEAFSQFQRRVDGRRVMGYALRTESHRLVEWREWASGAALATELYDHNNDDGEQLNVAGEEANQTLVADLRKRLRNKFPVRRHPLVTGVQSVPSPTRATLHISNQLAQPLKVWWIDPNGSRQSRPAIEPGATSTINSRAGHVFALESEDGSFHGLAYPGVPQTTFVASP